jgi:hypothetical protein
MDATRTQGAGTRSLRSIVLVVIACAIVLSIAMVGHATQSTSTSGQSVSDAVLPIALPKTDPAAQIHLRVAEALDKLRRQERQAGR